MDSLLGALAERNPDFRVVLRGDSMLLYGRWSTWVVACSFFKRSLPVVLAKGSAKFEYVPLVENPYWELSGL